MSKYLIGLLAALVLMVAVLLNSPDEAVPAASVGVPGSAIQTNEIAVQAAQPPKESKPEGSEKSPVSQIRLTGLQPTTSVSVDDILLAAAHSPDPDDNTVALGVVVACGIARDVDAELTLEDMVQLYEGDRERAKLLHEGRLKAKKALLAYCGNSAIPDKDAFLKKRVKLGVNLSQKVRDIPRTARARDEYNAAITQVLSNPAKYSFALHGWLEYVARKESPLMASVSHSQARLVRDELYHRLTGFPRDPNAIRTLLLCATYQGCPGVSELNEAQRQQALQVANQIEALIRQQRWQELFGPHGG